MYMSILWGCIIGAVLVFGVMVYSVATFRAEQTGTPASFRASFRRRSLIEVIWALIPIAICIAAALPAVRIVGASDVRVAETVE
jgi:cytochrome c oxidase subunit 2